MKKIRSTVTTGVASIGLVLGMAGFAGATTGSIDGTGRGSDNVVKNRTDWRSSVKNNNKVNATSNNDQWAQSGEARSNDNRGGGDAMTGSAGNSASAATSMSVDNSAGAGAGSGAAAAMPTATGSVSDTGRNSNNRVTNTATVRSTVENNNTLTVTNNNTQTAQSGDAKVTDNRDGGNATTGNVSNTSTTSTSVSIRN